MKILVTGSLGVIGSKLINVLTNNGHNVFGLDLFHTNALYGHGLGKVTNDNYFRCDISEYRQLKYIIDYVKPDLVYNCAAEFGRWNGEYFYDDLNKENKVTGDANIYPFWTGVFKNKNMLKSAINKIIEKKLDNPFPLKYSEKRKGKFTIIEKIFVPNYEGNVIWMHMCPLYLELLKKVNKNRYNLLTKRLINLIEKHKNYLEVFNPDQTPYKTFFYHADESMSWAANFLDIVRWKNQQYQ